MTLVLPSITAPTSVVPTMPDVAIPQLAQPQPNAGVPVIPGTAGATTSPPALALLTSGAIPANLNPTNAAQFANGLTSVLAQMSTGQMSHAALLTAANPAQYNGN